MSSNPIFMSVSATGTAETRFKSVRFQIVVNGRGKDAPEARAESDKIMTKVIAVIGDLNKNSADIDEDGLTCSYGVQPTTRWNDERTEQVVTGYLVTGTISCATENVDAATRIHDALSKVTNARADSPQFEVDDTAEVRAEAYRNAVSRIKQDFRMQCEALGLDPGSFEVASTGDQSGMGHRGGRQVMAQALGAMLSDAPAGSGSAPPEIRAGRAVYSTSETLNFAKKDGVRAGASSGRGKGKDGDGARSAAD